MLSAFSSASRRNNLSKIRFSLPLEHQLFGCVLSFRLAGELLNFLQAYLLVNCLVDLVPLHLKSDPFPKSGGLDSECLKFIIGKSELFKSYLRIVQNKAL